MKNNFVHLHVHTNYSLLRGAMRIPDAVARCKELGMSALAITDTNGLYGAVAFYLQAREMGIKPILGAEIEWNGATVVCLARNLEGYRNLCRLITARELQEDFDLVQAVVRHQEGLIILSSTPALLECLAPDLPRDSLYVELQIFSGQAASVFINAAPEPAKRTGGGAAAPEPRTLNPFVPRAVRAKLAMRGRAGDLRLLARRLGLPTVATNDVHGLTVDDYLTHCIVSAVRENILLSELQPSQIAHPEAYLKSPDEMAELFSYMPEAIENTQRIADECNFDWPMGRPIFPKADVPPGETAVSHLRQIALAGAAERYRPVRDEVRARLDHELDVIEKLGFSGYFIVVWGIVQEARRRGIPIVGRGSAADSLVSYCLGITRADPLHYNLYFERFLNPARTDPPDIDLDMCWRRRDEVLDYVYRRYGEDHVAMVANHNMYQARSAFRDIARVFGLPLAEIDDLSAALPHDSAENIRKLIGLYPETRRFPIGDEPYRTIVSIAERIGGFPRHLGIHVGGMVVGERPLTDYVPLQRATKGIVITQYEMTAIEKVGLVKMDLLGQRSLSAISDTAAAVRRRGVPLDLDTLPDGDPLVAKFASEGRTLGCFQIESPGMRNLLKMMKARTRDDLIVALSLIRPGPSASGMKERYIRRRLGLERPVYPCPELEPVLRETYGILLYQEHILKVAEAVAGFTLAEGDQLRKAITKERSPERIGALRERFLAGAARRSGKGDAALKSCVPLSQQTAADIWENIIHFAGFSFNKAHAVTYGQLAYEAVYLKSHFPAEYMAAVMSNLSGYYAPRVHLEEARRMGVRILHPDVNESEYRHTAGIVARTNDVNAVSSGGAEEDSPGRKPWVSRHNNCLDPEGRQKVAQGFSPGFPGFPEWQKGRGGNGYIRIGFMQVRDLARSTIEAILKGRAQGPFTSLRNFLNRVRITRPEAENLILCGAFDSLGLPRPALLWELYAGAARDVQTESPRRGRNPVIAHGVSRGESEAAPYLFSSHGRGDTALASVCSSPLQRASQPPDYTRDKKIQLELEILGMAVTDHPMALFRDRIVPFRPVPCGEVPRHVGKRLAVAGLVDCTRRTATADNKPMCFVTLEDATGLIEVVLFPPVYQRFGHLLSESGVLVVKGRVESDLGAVTLSAEGIKAV